MHSKYDGLVVDFAATVAGLLDGERATVQGDTVTLTARREGLVCTVRIYAWDRLLTFQVALQVNLAKNGALLALAVYQALDQLDSPSA